jgi:uncharacterized protein
LKEIKFKDRYGPTALIAGASDGLGAAYAEALAEKGFDLVLIARRQDHLDRLAGRLSEEYGVQVWPIRCDLSDPDATEQIKERLDGRMIHFLVYNAAASHIGPFLKIPISHHIQIGEVNILNPMKMIHYFGSLMIQERRGGIVLMSSLACFQGSGFLSSYSASKAFIRILAEGLWFEWKSKGVDIIACCAGATLTPNYIESKPKKIERLAPQPQLPMKVVEECLEKIGRTPSFVSGRANKIARFIMNHLFPLKKSIRIMGETTKKMYSIPD